MESRPSRYPAGKGSTRPGDRPGSGEQPARAAVVEDGRARRNAGPRVANNQPLLPFSDPGEAGRQAARDTLNRARAQLAEAGELGARVLRDQTDAAPEESSWLDDVGNFLADVGTDLVNGLASFGNAMLNHPDDVLTAAAGIGLTVISAAGEGLGVVLDATGVGAVPGVALNAASAAGMATGVSITGAAIANIATNAAGDDRVEPIKNDRGEGGGGGNSSGGQPVRRDDLTPDQQANLKRYEKKLPAGAEETKITRLDDGALQFESKVPGRVPGSSATYTKIVGEDGATVGYTKTTTLPDGSIAHVKDKMPK